jgi:hypothetical protein
VRRRHVQAEHFDEVRESRRLALGQFEDQSRQGGRVDDRVLERALQAAADEPGVEGVVAVLDEDRALGEAEKGPPHVPELRRADEHRPVDVVAPARVRVDGGATVDECVEEGQRAVEREALRPELEDQKRRVACGLDVEGDELCLFQRRVDADLGGVDRDLFPGHGLRGAARLEVDPPGRAHRASASARRAHAISSPVSARRSSTAAA